MIPLLITVPFFFKSLFVEDCLPFDLNDDANHTFVNLYAARQIMLAGQLPLMNMFNNFGTPLIGDLLTFPFAPTAWTYALMPDHLAIGFNRILLAILTVVALTFYLRRFMSLAAATLSAVTVFYSASFLWHFAHHHYQLSLLLFVLLIQMQFQLHEKVTGKRLSLFYLLNVTLFLSTNVQIIFIMFPFLIGHSLFLTRGRATRHTWLVAACYAAGLLFILPDFIAFLRAVPESGRVTEDYGYPFTILQLMKSVLGQVGHEDRTTHLDVAVHISVPVLVLSTLGLIRLWKRGDQKGLLTLCFVFGFIPLAVALFLTLFEQIRWNIPLIRSTDILRFWWFSTVFLLIPAGVYLDHLWLGKENRKSLTITGFVILSGVLAIQFVMGWEQVLVRYQVPVFMLPAVFILAGLVLFVRKAGSATDEKVVSRLLAAALMISVIAMVVPVVMKVTAFHNLKRCRSSHFYSYIVGAYFHPEPFLDYMEPCSRLATELPSARGQDLKGLRSNIFGSNSRSVLANKDFSDYLLKEGLVKTDHALLSYHFVRPWRKDLLSRLGIRYVIQSDPLIMETNMVFLKHTGWKHLTNDRFLWLFENPEPTTLVYMLEGERKINIPPGQVEFRGNGMTIRLPEFAAERELVATFMARPGWKASVDGRARVIHKGEDHMIRVSVMPGEQVVKIQYVPFPAYVFAAGFFGSLIIPTALFYSGLRRRRDSESAML